MQVSKNLAYYLDSYNGIYTFGITSQDEQMFFFLLEDILSKIQVKTVIKNVVKDTEWNFKDSVFFIDLDQTPFDIKGQRDYFNKLLNFCNQNNNSVIIKKSTYFSLDNNSFTIRPSSIIFASSIVLMIKDGIIKATKNRYDFEDIVDGNLIAFMREKKIDEILN